MTAWAFGNAPKGPLFVTKGLSTGIMNVVAVSSRKTEETPLAMDIEGGEKNRIRSQQSWRLERAMTNGWKETLVPPAKTQRMPGKTKGKDSYKAFLSGLCGLSEHSERARGNLFLLGNHGQRRQEVWLL